MRGASSALCSAKSSGTGQYTIGEQPGIKRWHADREGKKARGEWWGLPKAAQAGVSIKQNALRSSDLRAQKERTQLGLRYVVTSPR
jgi:hypothetical protein